ncbi:hypothetical protein RJ639_005187 [Escallonia herrerae]|uniref:Uncharacterized protein n=1 Tax=Escallonia herrerae TaxID=1293975 RepID=A0AA89AX62_9ASTE|nr:hypothetical protein RJ639_005187 [Escallonia herrerae]
MHLYSSSIPDRPVHIVSAVESDNASRALSLFSSSSILRVLGWDLEGKLIDRMWCLVLVFKEVAIDVLALTRGLKFLMVNSKLYVMTDNPILVTSPGLGVLQLEKIFRKAALVLIDRLNTDSKPFSMTSMRASSTSNLLCAVFIFSSLIEPHLHKLHSAASTLSNSFILSSWFSHAARLDINFETTDHRLGLFFKTGTDKNSKRDWKIEMLTVLTSLSTLITAPRW